MLLYTNPYFLLNFCTNVQVKNILPCQFHLARDDKTVIVRGRIVLTQTIILCYLTTLKYAYFPGCVAQGACRELYQSTQALTQALGIELIELKKAACCGSGTFKEDSQLLEDTVNARNIALAEELNLPLLTHCSTCQGVIGHVNERLKECQTSNPSLH